MLRFADANALLSTSVLIGSAAGLCFGAPDLRWGTCGGDIRLAFTLQDGLEAFVDTVAALLLEAAAAAWGAVWDTTFDGVAVEFTGAA